MTAVPTGSSSPTTISKMLEPEASGLNYQPKHYRPQIESVPPRHCSPDPRRASDLLAPYLFKVLMNV